MQPGNRNNSHGVDVSYVQGHPQWDQVRTAGGKDFAVIRVGYGAHLLDTAFPYNWPNVKAVGMKRAAYFFALLGETDPNPATDAQNQAAAFLAWVDHYGGIVAGDLMPFVDLESGGNPHGLSATEVLTWAIQWLDSVSAAIKVPDLTAGVYGPYSFLTALQAGPAELVQALCQHPLWVARWDPLGAPPNELGWTHWTCWQYQAGGTCPGISGPVDQDEWATKLDPAPPDPTTLTLARLQAELAALQAAQTGDAALAARVATLEATVADLVATAVRVNAGPYVLTPGH